jgi:GntR family transcriptional regulator
VSRMTVRQALGALERDGLVRRAVGRAGGTFVQEPKVERHPASTAGLSAELRRQGLAAGTEVVSAEVVPARPRTASALGLEPDEPVVVVVRVRLAAGKPLALERSSLPARLYPGIETLDLGGSLYELMGDAFGRRPERVVERLETVAARAADARALDVRPGAPLLLVERVGYGDDGTPLEFARDRFRGDRTRIVIESTEVEG